MAQASSQHKLDRVRAPRIQITYDVEIGDAIQVKTLPFHLAVLGDFSGSPAQPLPRLRDRTFVEVNPDNFDEVLEGMKPRVAFTVENRLDERDGAPALRVDLHFKTLEDFDAPNVARQIRPLRELLELRTKLNDLLGKLQGNDRLEELLTEVITDPDKLKKLESEIHATDAPAAPAPAEAASVTPESVADTVDASSAESSAVMTEPAELEEALAETESVAEEASVPAVEPEPVEVAEEAETVSESPSIPAAEPEHAEAAVEAETVSESAPASVAAPEHLEAIAGTENVSEAPSAASSETEPVALSREAAAPVDVPLVEAHASPAPETVAAESAEKTEEKKEPA